ncbi:MAG: HD-GYP domain-containing protein [Lachnospiraceae bacterium]|nr:HD-GYP domain-containing protein [Lachnospiraceae bacterium]
MVKLSTKDLSAGMLTASPIYSKTGQLLFPAHTILTSQRISHLEFYGIKEVEIIPENEVADSPLENPAQNEDKESYAQKVRRSRKFHMFKVDYTKKTNLLKNSFGNLIEGTENLDSDALLDQISSLYSNHLTSLSVFDMLHNMRQIDDTTYAHCINVAIISRMLGEWVELPEEDLEVLTLAGLLHDIGKCMVDPKILSKPGPLTPEEYKQVKKHPNYGVKILAEYDLDDRVRSAILMHHERCDGSGYPSGLRGETISDFAKIIAIADVYDAMTCNRCYRKGICPFEVIATFERKGFDRYESKFLLPFLHHIIDTYIGNSVLLNDGTPGKVIFINKQSLSRPVISTANNKYLDLTKHPELYIQAII